MQNWIRWILLLCTALIGGLISDGSAASGVGRDWPQFRGPARDGKSVETGLLNEWPADRPVVCPAWRCLCLRDPFRGIAFPTSASNGKASVQSAEDKVFRIQSNGARLG